MTINYDVLEKIRWAVETNAAGEITSASIFFDRNSHDATDGPLFSEAPNEEEKSELQSLSRDMQQLLKSQMIKFGLGPRVNDRPNIIIENESLSSLQRSETIMESIERGIAQDGKPATENPQISNSSKQTQTVMPFLE